MRNTKNEVYNACVKSALLYAAETWTVKKSDLLRLASWETRCIRRYLGARPEQDTTSSRAAANLGTSVDSHLRKMRLRWCGHVLRMGEERVTREALLFEKTQSWKRPPGGLRTTWRMDVKEGVEPILRPPRLRHEFWKKSWKNLCYEVAQDRLRWRAVVRDAAISGQLMGRHAFANERTNGTSFVDEFTEEPITRSQLAQTHSTTYHPVANDTWWSKMDVIKRY